MNILITGANGFIGKNLRVSLERIPDCALLPFDVTDPPELLREYLSQADVIFHLAGVNRPRRVEEFEEVNTGLTEQICHYLETIGRKPLIVLASSTQADLDNPYGRSKKLAEEALADFAAKTGAPVRIFRLPGVFGKWSKPNYNTVVATFCHNIARDLPIAISDPANEVALVYVDDVIEAFLKEVTSDERQVTRGEEEPKGQPLNSDIQPATFCFRNVDDRGSFTEFLKTTDRGQVSVNISKPGITKGNHWHQTKNEKFLVVNGKGEIKFRKIDTEEIVEYDVSGDMLEVVDIPPGYTHNITNTGQTDMVTVMWVNEPFDPEKPDTFFELV